MIRLFIRTVQQGAVKAMPGPPLINPAEFSRRTQQWMVGRPEIVSVSALMFPAYVLPLLDILVVLMFIRSFSSILGGDIEIGIS